MRKGLIPSPKSDTTIPSTHAHAGTLYNSACISRNVIGIKFYTYIYKSSYSVMHVHNQCNVMYDSFDLKMSRLFQITSISFYSRRFGILSGFLLGGRGAKCNRHVDRALN